MCVGVYGFAFVCFCLLIVRRRGVQDNSSQSSYVLPYVMLNVQVPAKVYLNVFRD